MMYLGLDVGSGTTKLSRYQENVPLASRKAIVPTAVLYRGLASEIPEFSSGGEQLQDAVRCDGFPAMLSASPSVRVTAWGRRTPTEVTQSFLRSLLDRRGTAGPQEDDLVITVPADRARRRDGGTELAKVLSALGHPPRRMLPAPIAALTYLRREHPELGDATRFAVCDIGAGGLSLALCSTAASGVQVNDVIRMSGTSAWSDDTIPGGATGARAATLAECLVAEMARIDGAPPAYPGDGRSVQRWRGLEAILNSAENEGSPGHELYRAFAAAGRHPGFGVLRFADVKVTVTQLHDACAPLADTAGAALTSLLVRAADQGWHHFGSGAQSRIVLIGGLSGLGPIRAALLRAAGLDPAEPGDAVVEADPVERLCAAAFGAALVAADKADPTVRYPYGVRLPVHRTVRDRIESGYLELAAAGTIAPDQAETSLMNAKGQPVTVTVPASRGPVPLSVALPVQLVRGDGAPPVPAEFRPAANPEAGDYRVSVAGDPAGMVLVLHSVKDDKKLRYTLRPPTGLSTAPEAETE
jgi:hypothetical protein